ncbi:hypothetical protein SAMN02745181_3447 [Rubritalea squalenifaciens DSM 18772]|uniref:Uncharacterized protein n=1 Tax=Rubritalea squalenifaciens DSM 18772 TaxID=1123071 RepID=A0A1M6QMQ4_9BACT|nr:hypothetical protein [Rubritalea squalenifaciens]SHK21532.1 hypothetical protein SAMN02745181_3447 [Rubritalea squalenifaciens DSM 18772]
MKKVIYVWLILVMSTTLLGGEKILPKGWHLFVVTKGETDEKFEPGTQGVYLIVDEDDQTGARAVEWQVYAKDHFLNWDSEIASVVQHGEMAFFDAFAKVCEMALAGKLGKLEVSYARLPAYDVVFESVKLEEKWWVRISANGRKVDEGNLYTPTEGLKWCKKVQEAKVAKAWYNQLLVAGELPEKTKGMRPPEVLKWEVYRRVEGWRGWCVLFCAPDEKGEIMCKQRLSMDEKIEDGQVRDPFGGEPIRVKHLEENLEGVLEMLGKAATEVKVGKDFEGSLVLKKVGTFQVRGDADREWVKVELNDGKVAYEVVFGMNQVLEISGQMKEAQVVKQWLEKNRGLLVREKQ